MHICCLYKEGVYFEFFFAVVSWRDNDRAYPLVCAYIYNNIGVLWLNAWMNQVCLLLWWLPQMRDTGFVQILEKFGKSRNLKLKFSRPWKVWKMIRGMEKSAKNPWKLWGWHLKYGFSLRWLILHHAFVTLLALYVTDILWSKLLYHIDIGKDDIDRSHRLKSKKFCHERYFLVYFVDKYGVKNHLENFWKYVIFSSKIWKTTQFSVRTLEIY